MQTAAELNRNNPYFKEETWGKDEDGRDYLAGSIEWQNGKRNGTTVFYWPNGNLKTRAEFKDDLLNGLHRTWHANGADESAGFYKNDQRIAIHEQYDDQGGLKCLIQYAETAETAVGLPPYSRKTYYGNKGPTLDLWYGKDNIITARHFPR